MLDPDRREGLTIVTAMAVGALVRGDYVAMENRTEGRRSADEFRVAVEGYGRELVTPPVDAYESIEIVGDDSVEPIHVIFPLWTADGPSDLVMESLLRPSPVSKGWWADDIVVRRRSEPSPFEAGGALDADLKRGLAIVVADIDVAVRQNDWVALSNNTDGKRPPEDFQRVVEGFPEELVAPPVSAYFEAEVEETDPGPPLRVRARFALWTAAGPSDLVTELDLRYKADLRFWYTDDVILFRTGGTSSG